MSFVRPSTTDTRIAEFAGKVVALKWTGQKNQIPTKINGAATTSLGYVARILSIEEGGLATDHGNTLIFQQALQNQLETNQGQWVVGQLGQRATGRKDEDGREQFYYLLDDSEMTDIDFQNAVSAFQRLNV